MKSLKLIAAAALLASSVAFANHSWNGYHWFRESTSYPVTIPVTGNFSKPEWQNAYRIALEDWNMSSVVKLAIGTRTTTPSTCNPMGGTIQVCNYNYGDNGWMGLTNVWTQDGHVSQATVKLNDFFFNQTRFNTAAWRSQTTCHEIGHAIGLDHQDEDFYNPATNTCLDYIIDPAISQHPNAHDYEQLVTIYGHRHTATTTTVEPAPTPSTNGGGGGKGKNRSVAPDAQSVGNTKANWGRVLRVNKRGQPDLFERDLGRGKKVLTYVHYAPPGKRR